MLRLQNITKEYSVADTKVQALKGISLSERPTVNEILGKLKFYSSGIAKLFDCVEPYKYVLSTNINDVKVKRCLTDCSVLRTLTSPFHSGRC